MDTPLAPDDEQAIRELVETWMAATRDGDTEAVLKLMADGVVFLAPDEEPFGKAAFAAMAVELESHEIDGSAEIEELEGLGDWAYLRTAIEMTLTPPDGEPVRRSGRTLSVLRKDPDGRWRLARDANLVTADE